MSTLMTIYDKHQDAQLRAELQQRWIAKHQLPLITLNTYLPQGMLKNPIGDQIFALAAELALAEINKLGGTIVKEKVFQPKCATEAMYVVAGLSANEIKKSMIKLETEHVLGAFFNFDVMNGEGKTISRKSCQLAARKCIICNRAASYCATYNKHSQAQRDQKAHDMLSNYFITQCEAI